MRAFDLLAKAEVEIRGSSQPRHHVRDGAGEVDPSAQADAAHRFDRTARQGWAGRVPSACAGAALSNPLRLGRRPPRLRRSLGDGAGGSSQTRAPQPAATFAGPGTESPRPVEDRRGPAARRCRSRRRHVQVDAFLEESGGRTRCSTAWSIAQAQRIDVEGDRIIFTFAPSHQALRAQLEGRRARARAARRADWPAGRKMRRRRARGRAGAGCRTAKPARRQRPSGGSSPSRKPQLRAGGARRLRRRDRGRRRTCIRRRDSDGIRPLARIR